MTERTDHERVRELLGREPRGRYEIVVRDESGDPVVLRNAPLLRDGTPMPTLYWLVSAEENRRIGTLEAAGGVDRAEADVDADELIAAHERYAAERDAEIPPGHDGPVPSGGVGGTRVGVKCLHAHWAWHLAGGDDPIGRWIEIHLGDADPSTPGVGVLVEVGDEQIAISHSGSSESHVIPWGHARLTERWLSDDDPPRPDALTNALGTISDHLDDLVRLHPDVASLSPWVFAGPTINSLAHLEAGRQLPDGDVDYPRPTSEEVFRLVATDPAPARAANPGLPSQHVEVIVATSIIVQSCLRRFDLDSVTLRVTTND